MTLVYHFRTRHTTQPGSESPHHLVVCSASARIGVVVRPDRTTNSHSPGRPLFDRVEQLDNAPMEGRNGELCAFDATHSRSRSLTLTQPKKDTTEDPQLWLGLLRRIPTSNTLPAGPLPESFSLFLTFCGRARRIASLFEEQPRCAEVDDPFVDFAIASGRQSPATARRGSACWAIREGSPFLVAGRFSLARPVLLVVVYLPSCLKQKQSRKQMTSRIAKVANSLVALPSNRCRCRSQRRGLCRLPRRRPCRHSAP